MPAGIVCLSFLFSPLNQLIEQKGYEHVGLHLTSLTIMPCNVHAQ